MSNNKNILSKGKVIFYTTQLNYKTFVDATEKEYFVNNNIKKPKEIVRIIQGTFWEIGWSKFHKTSKLIGYAVLRK